jgi:hypothetical protein
MPKICLILSIIIVILLGILYWLNITAKVANVEPYNNIGDNEHMREQRRSVEYLESKYQPTLIDKIQIDAYDPFVFADDKTIYNDQKNTSDPVEGDYELNDVVTDIINENNERIDWKNVYVNQNSKMFTVIQNPTTSIAKLFGRKGILDSDFKEDICTKYAGDYDTIDKKCNKLSSKNCKIPDCCVLLNGTKCVAGNIDGPIFLTENGKDIDQLYYLHKDQCFGNCQTANSYAAACDDYSKDSTGISKECMLQMFKNYGCPNPNPYSLINDIMVKNYSKTTKEYVEKYIHTAMENMAANYDDESKALCEGE